MDAQKQVPESVHFTVVQSVSEKDFEKIRALVLDAIRGVAKVAGPSPEEKLFAFTCDFFEPWGVMRNLLVALTFAAGREPLISCASCS